MSPRHARSKPTPSFASRIKAAMKTTFSLVGKVARSRRSKSAATTARGHPASVEPGVSAQAGATRLQRAAAASHRKPKPKRAPSSAQRLERLLKAQATHLLALGQSLQQRLRRPLWAAIGAALSTLLLVDLSDGNLLLWQLVRQAHVFVAQTVRPAGDKPAPPALPSPAVAAVAGASATPPAQNTAMASQPSASAPAGWWRGVPQRLAEPDVATRLLDLNVRLQSMGSVPVTTGEVVLQQMLVELTRPAMQGDPCAQALRHYAHVLGLWQLRRPRALIRAVLAEEAPVLPPGDRLQLLTLYLEALLADPDDQPATLALLRQHPQWAGTGLRWRVLTGSSRAMSLAAAVGQIVPSTPPTDGSAAAPVAPAAEPEPPLPPHPEAPGFTPIPGAGPHPGRGLAGQPAADPAH
ncbi:hypothetical protein CATMQ487_27250 [Sphaerotilus microaerophilus]|uniref:Uncharacterized protein n=2 Tax=Sphaerotilus microaerophilus TaxID=2914710 RepID=A0ABM7YMT2_9BURK|nr:hypothetical protein CATMQ487_27250 [Sphaerotilus sp. FB-5]